MAARNAKAFEQSQALRAEILRILLDHVQRAPLARAPTAKAINRQLTVTRPESTVRWHMQAIRDAADAELDSLASRQCID
jgi:hypothetical protein